MADMGTREAAEKMGIYAGNDKKVVCGRKNRECNTR